MSYILDALKRSEQERNQGQLTPTAVDTIFIKNRPVKQQWWPYLLIVILLLNLCAYLYYQYSSATTEVSQGDQTKNPNNTSVESRVSVLVTDKKAGNDVMQPVKQLPEHVLSVPARARNFDINDMPSSRARSPENKNSSVSSNSQPKKTENRVSEYNDDGFEVIRPKQKTASVNSPVTQSLDKPAESFGESEIVRPKQANVILEKQPSAPVKETSQHAASENLESIPHLSDLGEGFHKQMPDIRFNSHVYSDKPRDRRVMINDLFLREGEGFSGLKIITIGEFYLVLNKDGQSFKVPVLRDWTAPR